MTSSGLPSSFVVITSGGEVRRINTDTGTSVATYGTIPLGNDEENGVTQARSRTIPGSEDILISLCCEPVGGNVYTITGPFIFNELSPSYVGSRVAPSPDGSMVATGIPAYAVIATGLASSSPLIELVTGLQDSIEVAWDPTRAAVIWTPSASRPDKAGLEVNRSDLDQINGEEIEILGDTETSLFNRSLAVRPDGVVLVAGCPTIECVSTILVEVDIVRGSAEITRELGYVAALGGFDPTGQVLIATDADGNVHFLSEDTDIIVLSGVHWASW